jgi:hypothetical protein
LVSFGLWLPRRRAAVGVGVGVFAALLALLGWAGVAAWWEAVAAMGVALVALFVRVGVKPSVWGAALSVVIGIVALTAGGNLTEAGATRIASGLGMSDELIGLTIVALATSLPELATSVQAVRRGTVDIAVGNVVGSNIFNILLVMGATAVVGDVTVPADGWASLGMMALLSALLVPMSRVRGPWINRLEGLTLLAVYLGFMAWAVSAAVSVPAVGSEWGSACGGVGGGSVAVGAEDASGGEGALVRREVAEVGGDVLPEEGADPRVPGAW